MIRPRWHKVRADLLDHKIRSALVVASIAVGLFAIGVITRTYFVLSADIRSGYEEIAPANIYITLAGFDQDLVDQVARLPGVGAAVGARQSSLRVLTSTGDWEPIAIHAERADDLTAGTINRILLQRGVWPPGDHEIAIDIARLDDLDLDLGDMVSLKLPSGVVRQARLVAVVQDQTIGAGSGEGGFFVAPVQGYVTTEELAWLEQPESLNMLYVRGERGDETAAELQTLADQVLERLRQWDYSTYGTVIRTSDQHPNVSYVDAMVAVIFALGLVVVSLSAFLITNTLSSLLEQQIEQIGVIKTVGGTRGEVTAIYTVLILVYSAIALAIAIPTSIAGAQALLSFLAGALNFVLQGARLVPQATALQVALALVVPLAAGSAPIRRGARTSVREALSSEGAGAGEGGLLYDLLARVPARSRPLMISLRNTFRRKGRLALTLVTLTLGGAAFIATIDVINSIEAHIDTISGYFAADVNITFSEAYRTVRVQQDVLAVPGVASVESWQAARAQVVLQDGTAGESVQVLAPAGGSRLVQPTVQEGRWLEAGEHGAITLSEEFHQDYPWIDLGDTITLRIGTRETDWVVVGYFQFAGRSAGLYAYTDYETLARALGNLGGSSVYRVRAADEGLDLAGQEALADRIEERLVARGYEVSQVQAGRSLESSVAEGLNILTTFLLVMSLLMALVGSIGLMGTMSLNVLERTREIGVMRAIGGTNRAITTIVLAEGAIIGLISWLVASVVALPFAKSLADVLFRIMFNRNAQLVLTLRGNVIWLGLVLLLAVSASIVPAYNATRLTIREVLAYE